MRGSAAMDSSLILIIQKDREKEKDSPLYPVNITVNFSFSRYSERKFPALAMGQPKRPSNRLLSPLKSRLRPIGQGTKWSMHKKSPSELMQSDGDPFFILVLQGILFLLPEQQLFLVLLQGGRFFLDVHQAGDHYINRINIKIGKGSHFFYNGLTQVFHDFGDIGSIFNSHF